MMVHFRSTIGFLLFDDLEELDFVGPYEIFNLWKGLGGPGNVITISEKPIVRCSHGLKVVTDYGFENCPQQIDYLVVPGGKGTRSQVDNQKFISFLQSAQQKLKCKYFLSVCTGSFLLQRAGLLKGMNATTYWGLLDRLRKFKNVNVLEERVVKNENVWTSAGISAGIDLALEFVAHIDGDEMAGKVQFEGEYYPQNKRYGSIHRDHPKAPKYLKSKAMGNSRSDLQTFTTLYGDPREQGFDLVLLVLIFSCTVGIIAAVALFVTRFKSIAGWVQFKLTDLMEGDGKFQWGHKVWYICPEPGCKREVWALESWAGSPCFGCWGVAFLSAFSYDKIVKKDPAFWNRSNNFELMKQNGKAFAFHPKSTFKYSNFRVLYNRVTAEQLSDEQIIKILIDAGYDGLADVYKSSRHDCIGKKCVQLWTEWSPFHKRLTDMLIFDRYDDLKTFMPIIRGITSQLVSPSIQRRETYRGSKIFMKQFDAIQINSIYRIPQFLATSMCEYTARNFCEGDCVMVKFVIPSGCWNAASISGFSTYPQEREILFPPYTAIIITNKSKEDKLIECEVLENVNVDKNVESRIL